MRSDRDRQRGLSMSPVGQAPGALRRRILPGKTEGTLSQFSTRHPGHPERADDMCLLLAAPPGNGELNELQGSQSQWFSRNPLGSAIELTARGGGGIG
jgi:hypothetical protein